MPDNRDWFDDLRAVRDFPADPEIKHVLLVMMTFIRQDSCWPSIQTISGCLGLSLDATRARLRRAHEAGFLSRDARFVQGKQTTNRYTIDFGTIYRLLEGGGADAPLASTQGVRTPTPPPCVDAPQNDQSNCNKKKKKEYSVKISWNAETGWEGEDLVAVKAQWTPLFPALDIERQFRMMHEWLRQNPERARKSAWGRFAFGWLKREQERGGDIRTGTKQRHSQATKPVLFESAAPTARGPRRVSGGGGTGAGGVHQAAPAASGEPPG